MAAIAITAKSAVMLVIGFMTGNAFTGSIDFFALGYFLRMAFIAMYVFVFSSELKFGLPVVVKSPQFPAIWGVAQLALAGEF